MITELPMFPLGNVLMPGLALPLHVFEPRYQALVERCLTSDGMFGTVLIERGFEVGGGDHRFDVGTRAEIVESDVLPGGRWAILAVGRSRFRVRQWAEDDPYPLAEVDDWDDPPPTAAGVATFEALLDPLRDALELKLALGEAAVRPTVELADDPALAAYQACAIAPIGPVDQYRLLTAPSADERMTMLAAMVEDQQMLLRARLQPGTGLD